jgi:hypothetical protein
MANAELINGGTNLGRIVRPAIENLPRPSARETWPENFNSTHHAILLLLFRPTVFGCWCRLRFATVAD